MHLEKIDDKNIKSNCKYDNVDSVQDTQIINMFLREKGYCDLSNKTWKCNRKDVPLYCKNRQCLLSEDGKCSCPVGKVLLQDGSCGIPDCVSDCGKCEAGKHCHRTLMKDGVDICTCLEN